MTRADLKHCGKIPEAREDLNRSVREWRIESRHSIKSLEGMGSSSHDLGAELRMHSYGSTMALVWGTDGEAQAVTDCNSK